MENGLDVTISAHIHMKFNESVLTPSPEDMMQPSGSQTSNTPVSLVNYKLLLQYQRK